MSFNTYARKMREPEQSFARRRTGFRACLEYYCWLSKQSHRAIYARFADEFGSDEKVPDANERILRALDALEIERNQKLEQLRLFDIQHAKAKMRGRRTLSKAEQKRLEAIRQDSFS